MTVATLSLEQAARRCWDVVVVGAGPAGAFAAHELCRTGLQVLVVDKARFPREKVCGCCLNDTVIGCLEKGGRETLLAAQHAVPLTRLELYSRGSMAQLPLARQLALSRAEFDSALLMAAVNEGAHFLAETTASLGRCEDSHREVRLAQRNGLLRVRSRLVLAADGLSGRFSASRHHMDSRETSSGWLGVQTLLREAPAAFREHTLYMACGTGGYVGLVRLEDHRLNIAAALDPHYLRLAGTVSRAVTGILAETNVAMTGELREQRWHGTPSLTHQSRHLARDRLFVLGDAAGFVQPFTGEGIAWALLSAEAVIPLSVRAVKNWNVSLKREWSEVYRRTVIRKQNTCRVLSALVRFPTPTSVMVWALGRAPKLGLAILCWLGLSGPRSFVPISCRPRSGARTA